MPEQNARAKLLWELPSWLAAITLFTLMVMTFFDVILRSTINDPIESATELTRLFMAIIVFSSLPVITFRGGHIVVDLLDPFFGPLASRIRDTLVDLVCGVVLFWPAMRVFALAERARSYNDLTEYLEIPQFYIAYFIAVATTLTAVVFIVRAVVRWVRPDWLQQEAAEVDT
ncbi:MAG: TRAP transporter small permease [Pseudomonadota bacterium]